MRNDRAMRDLAAAVLVSPAGGREFRLRLLPFLDHVGVPHRVNRPGMIADAPLIVIGHGGFKGSTSVRGAVMAAVERGAGLVTFDPTWPTPPSGRTTTTRALGFPRVHWITAGRADRRLTLIAPLRLPVRLPGATIVASASGAPLVTVTRHGRGRIVRWACLDWADPAVLGPLGGLDGTLWRSMVWAARKPFVIRALPPLVAMRVDDVAGTGERWGLSPLWWIREARRAGFKPWLGLFTHNLSPAAIRELSPMLRRRDATAFPHAFGRISATVGPDLSWHDPAPLPAGDGPDGFGRTDAFVFWDHAGKRAWPDAEARRRLDRAEAWWRSSRFPMSRVFLPHWYEAGTNTAARVHDRWGARLTATVKDPASALEGDARALNAGPFRRHGTSMPATPHAGAAALGRRPVYYAEGMTFGGRRFFNCLTEIRDLGGYEWTPNADRAATVARGTAQLGRAIDSLALAVLFTHETDHLWKIPPKTLRAEFTGVARGIHSRRPIFVTLDGGIQAVEATRTARIESVTLDERHGRIRVSMSGRADVETSFRCYRDSPSGPSARTIRVRPFRGRALTTLR